MVCAKRITEWAFGSAPHWTSVKFKLIYQTVGKASRPIRFIADLHEGFHCCRDEPLSTALLEEKNRHEVSVPYQAPRDRSFKPWGEDRRKRQKELLSWGPNGHMLAVGQSSGKMILSISPGAQQGGEARGNGDYTVVSWGFRLGGPVAEEASSLAHFAHLACRSGQAPLMWMRAADYDEGNREETWENSESSYNINPGIPEVTG